MKILTYTNDITREEWLDTRRQGIGGSDAAAILGLNPWSSPYRVYLEKIGEAPVIEVSKRMEIGTKLEDFVAKEFEQMTGLKVRRRNAIFQHEDTDLSFMLANIDRDIVGREEGLEVKVTNSYAKSDWADGKIPVHYEIQCHHYMAVTGYKAWWIAALIGNEDIVIQKIDRDEETLKLIIEGEKSFWNDHVLARVAPGFSGTEGESDILAEQYPEATEETIDLQDFDDKLDRLAEIKVMIKELTIQKDVIEQELKSRLGTAGGAVSARYTISYKNQSRTSIDTARLKKEEPKIFEVYSKTTQSRVLRVNANEKED